MVSTSRPRLGGLLRNTLLNLVVLLALVGAALLVRPLLPDVVLSAAPRFESKPGLQSGTALNDDGNVDFPNSLRSNLPLIRDAGAGWVRIEFRLGNHFRDWTTKDSRGISAIEYYDVLVNEARDQNGLKVLGVISHESWPGTQDEWRTGNAEYQGGNGDNAYLQAFSQQAVVVLVERFQGRVDEWEIWDEPNAFTTVEGGEPHGGSYIYPSNFAQLLRHVWQDTRRFPKARIVSGGLLSTDHGVRPRQGVPAHVLQSTSGGQYVSETYRLGRRLANWDTIRDQSGSYPLDDVGVHLYVDQSQPTTAAKVKSAVEEVRDAYVAFEGPKTPKRLVITEVGWSTSLVSQKIQAGNLQTTYATLIGLPYVRNAYWYLAQDVTGSDDAFGLQTAGARTNQYNGIPKLALDAYREITSYQPAIDLLGFRLRGPSPLSYLN